MKDLNKKTDKELNTLLAEHREDSRKFRFDISGSKVKNVLEGGNTRKNIARILTELRARKDAKSVSK